MVEERRNANARAAITQRIVNSVLQNPSVTLSVDTLHAWLGLHIDAADRILRRLASSSGKSNEVCGRAARGRGRNEIGIENARSPHWISLSTNAIRPQRDRHPQACWSVPRPARTADQRQTPLWQAATAARTPLPHMFASGGHTRRAAGTSPDRYLKHRAGIT